MSPAAELAELVAQQARDDAAERIGSRFPQESQIGDPDGPGMFAATADPAPSPFEAAIERELYTLRGKPSMNPPIVLVGVNHVWGRAAVAYVPTKGRCPACGDRRLSKVAFCLVCSRSGADPEPHPQQAPPVAKAGNGKVLAGGVGPKLKRGRRNIWADHVPAGAV